MLLAEAEDASYVNLDSTNIILDKISNPEHLTIEQKIKYNKLKVLYQINQSMEWDSADSLNNVLLDYYIQKKDTVLLKDALFNSGWISLNNNNPDKAIEQFFKFESALDKHNVNYNYNLQSCYYHISRAYLDKKDTDNALHYAKKIPSYFIAHDTLRNARFCKSIAYIYRQMNDVDSAMLYYDKALAFIGESSTSRYDLSHIFNEICELQLGNNNFKEALKYIDLSLQNRAAREDISFFNLTKARVFLAANQTDSAKIYFKRTIESSENDFISIAAYKYLANLYKSDGDYANAFYRRANQKDVIEKSERLLSGDFFAQKYREEKLKNENNELKLAKREQEILFLSIALVSLIIIVSLWLYLLGERKRKKIKEQALREEALLAKSLLVENENKLLKQDNELILLKEKSAVLRESLFRKMAVSKKIPSLNTIHDDNSNQASGKIRLEELDWDELISTVDELFGGFALCLKKEYPNLSKEDIGFCCLVKINVSMQDLADIYCITKAGITKRKTRLKKDKLNILDENVSLDVFLASL